MGAFSLKFPLFFLSGRDRLNLIHIEKGGRNDIKTAKD